MNIKRIGLIGGNGVVGGGNSEELWTQQSAGVSSLVNNNNIYLGADVVIDNRVYIDSSVNIGSDVHIGVGVYIQSGFDSRNISSSGGDGLWRQTDNYGLQSVTDNRNIRLGTDVFIGDSHSLVEITVSTGIHVWNTDADIFIGSHVTIGASGEFVEISSDSLKINSTDNSTCYMEINQGFKTNDYFNIPNKKIIPAALPFENLSNGNIKIGDTLFMPATPSGDPLHYAYEAAGAKYNATTDFIVKDAPWKDMVDTIEDKAKWGFDVVDARQVKQMTIGGTTYNYVQTTRKSPEGTTEPRYFLVGQASDGTWVEDETKVLHIPGHWYLRGLGDITNAEMRRIIENKFIASVWEKSRAIQSIKTRTLLHPYTLNFTEGLKDIANLWGVMIESFGLGDTNFKNIALEYCIPASEIIGNQSNLKYFACLKNLTKITHLNVRVLPINQIRTSVKIDSPVISKESIRQNILNADPISAIAITLHANAYARLVNDSDIVATLEAKNAALEGTGGSISLVSA